MGFRKRASDSHSLAYLLACLPACLYFCLVDTSNVISIHLNIVSILPLFWVCFVFFDSALIDRARCFVSSYCIAVCPYEVYMYIYVSVYVVRSSLSRSPHFCSFCLVLLPLFNLFCVSYVRASKKAFISSCIFAVSSLTHKGFSHFTFTSTSTSFPSVWSLHACLDFMLFICPLHFQWILLFAISQQTLSSFDRIFIRYTRTRARRVHFFLPFRFFSFS